MKLFKEPLLHFLLLGVVIFAVFAWRQGPRARAPDEIVVTAGKVLNLAALFERTWQRPPSDEELDGLIQDYIREETLYREGIALGLDRDDTIVRRRVRQKLEFLSDDISAQREPTEVELRQYLEEHPEAFRAEPVYSFRQVFLSPEVHGEAVVEEARRLLDLLQRGGAEHPFTELGDRTLQEQNYRDVRYGEIARLFTRDFADALAGQPVGVWCGPLASAYGLHLVHIDEAAPARMPDLDEVRDAVAREWAHARRVEAREAFYEGILSRYEVTIERP